MDRCGSTFTRSCDLYSGGLVDALKLSTWQWASRSVKFQEMEYTVRGLDLFFFFSIFSWALLSVHRDSLQDTKEIILHLVTRDGGVLAATFTDQDVLRGAALAVEAVPNVGEPAIANKALWSPAWPSSCTGQLFIVFSLLSCIHFIH